MYRKEESSLRAILRGSLSLCSWWKDTSWHKKQNPCAMGTMLHVKIKTIRKNFQMTRQVDTNRPSKNKQPWFFLLLYSSFCLWGEKRAAEPLKRTVSKIHNSTLILYLTPHLCLEDRAFARSNIQGLQPRPALVLSCQL